MKLFRVMTLVAIATLLGSAGARTGFAQSAVDSPRELFTEANARFESGDYEEAATGYRRLVDAGVADADLFYNLANTYYKLGNLGEAVLFYERALKLAPRDGDTRENLRLLRSLLGDRQFVESPNFVKRVVTGWRHRLTTRESFLLLSVMYFLLGLSVLFFVLRRVPRVDAMYRALSIISPGRLLGLDKSRDMVLGICTLLLLTAIAGTSAFEKRRADIARARAVVVAEEAPVYSGPTDAATLQFNVHAGTIVRITDTRPGWGEVRLPGDLSGWIELPAVERI